MSEEVVEPKVEETDTEGAEVKGEIFREKVGTVEALRFDGENGEDVIKFAGGKDFGKITGDEVLISLSGRDPRSQKREVTRGQWLVKGPSGVSIMNEADFAGRYETGEGEPVEALEPKEDETEEPVPDDKLVYQPGFGPTAGITGGATGATPEGTPTPSGESAEPDETVQGEEQTAQQAQKT